jgi:UDP-N-acetylmuramoylalanine--D-glutamate ligase
VAAPRLRPEDFRRRRVAVVGLGMSNRAVVRFLLACGAHVVAFDRADVGGYADELRAAGVPLHAGPDYLDALEPTAYDRIVLTPGMRKDLPPLRRAAEAGVPLDTEAGLVLAMAPAPVVGITGSAGKTTTTTLVGLMAARHRPGSVVGGNIGRPLVESVAGVDPGAWIVLELSSFQLELARVSPQVAAVLNLRPNHLDVHGSFAAYAAAKRNVFAHQGPEDVAVFPLDDPGAAAMAAEAPGRVLRFSALRRADACLDGGWVVRAGERVLPVRDIRLPGAHNVQNVLAATALSLAMGIPARVLASVVSDFRGVEHRLELVAERGGAAWINDSIATAPDRTEAALRTFTRPVLLLAGGYDKGLSFDQLAPLICARVRVLILFGKTADAIAAAVEAAGGGPEVVRVADLAAAVHEADARARAGDVVLLSPACASYDQFRNFEERGRRFKDLVAALPEIPTTVRHRGQIAGQG